MSALEQQIIEKLHQLDDAQKVEVLAFIDTIETHEKDVTLAKWLDMARQSRAATRTKYGSDYVIDAQSLLDEVREERLDDLMGGR